MKSWRKATMFMLAVLSVALLVSSGATVMAATRAVEWVDIQTPTTANPGYGAAGKKVDITIQYQVAAPNDGGGYLYWWVQQGANPPIAQGTKIFPTTVYGSPANYSTQLSIPAGVPEGWYDLLVELRDSWEEVESSGNDTETSCIYIDNTPPVVDLTAPVTGTILRGGSTANAIYNATDANMAVTNPIKIEYQRSGESTWNTVYNGSNTSPASWTVPLIDGNITLRCTATDKAGNTGNDTISGIIIDSTPPGVIATTLMSPNGGGFRGGGFVGNIVWNTTDVANELHPLANPVKLEFFNGTAWSLISDNEPNDGVYSWTTPMIDAAGCSVRITATDVVGNSASDQCNNHITIDSTLPVVHVISPDGGELMNGGGAWPITYTAFDTNMADFPITIDFSSDNGTTWSQVATGLVNNGTYPWTIPSISTNQALIRVTARDKVQTNVQIGSDTSNSTFTIDNSPPIVSNATLISPNGGEFWSGLVATGNTRNITWNTALVAGSDVNLGPTPVSLYYYNGTAWVEIATGLGNTGSYSWTVPPLNIGNARVRIVVTDLFGGTGSDESNADFTIDSIPPAFAPGTITFPAGGSYVPGSSSQTITWTPSGITDVNLRTTADTLIVSYNNGAAWIPVATQTNSGSCPWTVPSLNIANAKVAIRAYDKAGNSALFITPNFTIDSTNPVVTVTSPNGGEIVAGGSTRNITWTANDTNMATNPITIEYFNGSAWVQEATGEVNDGTYSWTVPSLDINTASVRVTAVDRAGLTGSDTSNGNFTIDSTIPTVLVLSPNGGEVWLGGSTHDITWTANDTNMAPNPITIDFFNGLAWVQIATGEANDGVYAWTIPTTRTVVGGFDADNALIKVTAVDLAGHTGNDTSDNTFIVDGGPPTIEITSEMTGLNLAGGSIFNITWTAYDPNLANVTLEFFNGTGWETLTISTVNGDDFFLWTVPAIDGTNFMVRATALDEVGLSAFDETGPFTIDGTGPIVTVIIPNGGQIWGGGTTHNITWNATDAGSGVANVTIEFWNNDTSTWVLIASDEPNDGTYEWTIPAGLNFQSLIRVTAYDLLGNSGFDVSDEPFTIDSSLPEVTVTNPVGGEIWQGGSTHNVTYSVWDSSILSWTIGYGQNGVFIEIANGTTNGNFSTAWLVPMVDGDNFQVQLTAIDTVGNSASFTTGNFTIDSTAPVVTIDDVDPDGDYFKFGDVITIYYTASDANLADYPITIGYTDGNGTHTIEGNLANDGYYDWTIDIIDPTRYINGFWITAVDKADNEGNDTWDDGFWIDNVAPSAPELFIDQMYLNNTTSWLNRTVIYHERPTITAVLYEDNLQGGDDVTAFLVEGDSLNDDYSTRLADENGGWTVGYTLGSWETANGYSWYLNQGYYYVNVTVADEAGNTASAYGIFYLNSTHFMDLTQGWNLVSVPVIPDEPFVPLFFEGFGFGPASVTDRGVYLNNSTPEGLIVWSYDAATGEWNGNTYADWGDGLAWHGMGDNTIGLWEINDGPGYWVYTPEELYLIVSGSDRRWYPGPYVPIEYDVQPGWNLIGLTYRENISAEEYLETVLFEYMHDIGNWDPLLFRIQEYDPVWGWKEFDYDISEIGEPDELLVPGRGYWFFVRDGGTIVPPLLETINVPQ